MRRTVALFSLTFGTEKGRALSLFDLSDNALASLACQTWSRINEVVLLKIAGVAIRTKKITQTTSTRLYRLGQCGFNFLYQSSTLRFA
jgi:hypothetical protein